MLWLCNYIVIHCFVSLGAVYFVSFDQKSKRDDRHVAWPFLWSDGFCMKILGVSQGAASYVVLE